MKVKEIIISALNILGRNELADSVSAGAALDTEGQDTVNTLLYCFNAVEDELARKYMPLTAREGMISPNGKFYFVAFKNPPVRIKRVFVGGEKVDFEVFAQYVAVNAKEIEVEYEYAPAKKGLDGTCDFGSEAGERLFALGSAAEYCLINGEVEAADLWESKYRKEIDMAQSKLPAGGYIPPRRWV